MMNKNIRDAREMAKRLINNYMGVRPNEEVFIVVDPATDMIMPNALARATTECGAQYTIATMPASVNGENATTCTNIVAMGATAADVYIGMTRSSGASVYDGRIFELVGKGKLRLCSMVMRDLDNYIKGGALADYEVIDKEGQRLAYFWKNKKQVKITSPAGTCLQASIGNHKPIIECGIAREPGEHMAFSDGEVSQGPNEGSMNGTLVIDGPICQLGLPASPVTMEVVNGLVHSITGEDLKVVDALKRIISNIPQANNIAEIGIGLNPSSLFNGDFEEEKKARGTCHIAIGDNICYGGTVKCDVHIDMVMYKPTIVMDNILVVSDGQVMMENIG
jgi:leucyl aminopeptidase (aminopeptidase T)